MAIYLPKSNFTRFAFYSSLNTHLNVSRNDPKYTSLDAYDMAMNYLSRGLSKMTEDKDSSAYKQALQLLKTMADNQLQKQQKLLLSKIHDKNFPEELRQLIQKNCDLKNFNYENFLRGLNTYYLKAKDLTSKIDATLEDMKTISAALESAYSRYRNFKGNKWVKLKRRTLQLSNPGRDINYLYGSKQKGEKTRLSKGAFDKFVRAKNNLEKSKINIAMLDTKAYGELSNKLIAALGKERKQEIYDAIVGNSIAKDNIIKILDYITLLFFQDYVNKTNVQARKKESENFNYKSIKDLLLNDEPNKEADIEFIKAVNEAYSFFKNNTQLLEKLTEDIFGQSLAYNRIIQLKQEAMKEAKDLIKDLNLGENGEKLIIKSGSGFSVDEKKWQRARKQAAQQGKEAIEKFEKLQGLRQKHAEVSKAQRLKAGKKGSLSVGAEISQAIESGIQRSAIKSIQKGSLGGKDDTLTAHLIYTPPDFNLSQTPEVTDEATRMIDEAMAKISDIADGGAMSTKDLKGRLKKQEAIYRELEKNLEELREKISLDKDTLNIFMEHGTTKEYTFLNNSLGFKAGALGENHDAISAINNIQLMAHKGGISFVDREWLIFAVTNCARHLIGAEINIQSSLENYLSLIAGALMFEDSDKIMLEVNKKIQTRAPETVEHIHIYRLNSFFFPLSFILYKTWEDLSALENFLEDAKHSGNQVHIDNSASWSAFKDGVFKETWIKEGKYSINSTTITMTFMAGFLDVIENLKITSP